GAAARSAAQRRGARLAAGGLGLVASSMSLALVLQLLARHPDALTPHWFTVAARAATAAGAIGWTAMVVALWVVGSGAPSRAVRVAIAAALANAAASLGTVVLVWSPALQHAGRWPTFVVESSAGLSWALFAVVPLVLSGPTGRIAASAGAALACAGFLGVSAGTVVSVLVIEQLVTTGPALQAAWAALAAGWVGISLGGALLSRRSITPATGVGDEQVPALATA
ncbi:MAG TPA: hypothetical protein VKT18_03395, partial [Acidimicrobiales bacterium]|nr:hypothetical protein [Acidimicrobiales bacterium]